MEVRDQLLAVGYLFIMGVLGIDSVGRLSDMHLYPLILMEEIGTQGCPHADDVYHLDLSFNMLACHL